MTNSYRIALYPGDGIGPEVVDATRAVLDAARAPCSADFISSTSASTGAWPTTIGTARSRPTTFSTTLRGFDAIFLGAVGWPARLPDHVTLAPLIRTAPGVRPLRLRAAGPHFSRRAEPAPQRARRSISSSSARTPKASTWTMAASSRAARRTKSRSSRRCTRAAASSAFCASRSSSPARRRRRLTMITKSNAQRFAYVLWDRVLEEMTPRIRRRRDGQAAHRRGDAGARAAAAHFDVVVGSNLFGDILSDLDRRHHRQPRAEPVRESRSRAAVAVAVRAGARLGAGHRGQGHRQSRPARSSAPR